MKGLDKYLLHNPFEVEDSYAENVIDCFSEDFYTRNKKWIAKSDNLDRWLLKLYSKGVEPEWAARLIERTHRRYLTII